MPGLILCSCNGLGFHYWPPQVRLCHRCTYEINSTYREMPALLWNTTSFAQHIVPRGSGLSLDYWPILLHTACRQAAMSMLKLVLCCIDEAAHLTIEIARPAIRLL